MKLTIASALIMGVAAFPAFAGGHASGDAAEGEKAFRQCKACHAIVDADGNEVMKGGKTGRARAPIRAEWSTFAPIRSEWHAIPDVRTALERRLRAYLGACAACRTRSIESASSVERSSCSSSRHTSFRTSSSCPAIGVRSR